MASQLCFCLHTCFPWFNLLFLFDNLDPFRFILSYFGKKRVQQNLRTKRVSALEIKLAVLFYCLRPSPRNNLCNIAESQRILNKKKSQQFDKTQTSCVMQLKVRQGDKSFNLPLGDIHQILD